MYFQQYNLDLKFMSDSKNSSLFSLVDSHDTLLQLKGIPWAFSVVFYTRSTTSELHKQELRIERQFKSTRSWWRMLQVMRKYFPPYRLCQSLTSPRWKLSSHLVEGATAMRPHIMFPKDAYGCGLTCPLRMLLSKRKLLCCCGCKSWTLMPKMAGLLTKGDQARVHHLLGNIIKYLGAVDGSNILRLVLHHFQGRIQFII